MTFAIRNLSVLAYANGFTLWHYRADAGGLPPVAAAGFFDPAADMLVTGDMVLVSAPEGGRVLVVAAGEAGIATAPLGYGDACSRTSATAGARCTARLRKALVKARRAGSSYSFNAASAPTIATPQLAEASSSRGVPVRCTVSATNEPIRKIG